jgi:integrase
MTEQSKENRNEVTNNLTPKRVADLWSQFRPQQPTIPKKKATNLKGAPKSKRHDTARLPPTWREDLWEMQLETLKTQKGQNYKDSENFTRGLAISWLTGLRPTELQSARCLVSKQGRFGVIIDGAKVKKDAEGKQLRGIDQRTLVIDAKHPAAAFLIEQIGQGNYKWMSEGKSPEDTFRKSVNRLGKKYLANKRSKKYDGLSISPYCYRHAMGSDLKTILTDEVNIAKIMGHLSTDSVAKYGRKRRTSKNKLHITGVHTSQTPHTPERSVKNLSQRNRSAPAPAPK